MARTTPQFADNLRLFLRNKRSEWEEYRKQVTPYELNRYLPVL
ncbi:hypothetical protein GCM10009839_34140 [Catenulispora yoronensis]|uniref:Glutamine synthetase n=1 Tax=Catenulispora yoronensis TaxID=450799 RepID=A0ABP5FSM8_9ACTN